MIELLETEAGQKLSLVLCARSQTFKAAYRPSVYWSCYPDAEIRKSLRPNELRMHNRCMDINC